VVMMRLPTVRSAAATGDGGNVAVTAGRGGWVAASGVDGV
jgi:hypothetical protein